MDTRIVSLLSGGNGFYRGACGMIGLLQEFAPEYRHELMIEEYKYTPEARAYLEGLGWVLNSVTPHRSKWTKFAAKRWPNTFTKINLWNLDCDKAIYMDLDAAPLGPLSQLDEATPGSQLYVTSFPGRRYRFRSGLMVLRPNKEIYGDLVELLAKNPKENGAKLGDQGLLNIYFKGKFAELQKRFHVVEKPIPKDPVVRHLRPKPWGTGPRDNHYRLWQSHYAKNEPPGGMQICRSLKK